MTARSRWVLWIALVAGLASLVVMDRREAALPAVVDTAPRLNISPVNNGEPIRNAGKTVTLKALIPRTDLIRPKQPHGATVDLFAAKAWVPGEPAPALALPTPPAPPPDPGPQFTYVGKRKDEQGWQVYLALRDVTFIVREGETIDGGFRVESIKPPTLTLASANRTLQIAIGEWE